MIVYLALDTVNGKLYIGKSMLTSNRDAQGYFREHIRLAMLGNSERPRFYDAIREHGPEAFRFAVIYQMETNKQICQMEKAIIAAFHTTDENYGYNMTNGGNGGAAIGRKPSEKSRRALLTHLRGNNYGSTNAGRPSWSKGKHFSEEHKRKIGEANRLRALDPATKSRMRLAAIAREARKRRI